MRTLLALALSASAVLSLAACAPEDHALPGSTATPAPSVTATSTPSATPTADAGETPITVSCAQLVSDDVMYSWGNGNFALNPDYAPAAGSAAETAVDAAGISCGWINLTSGETVVVSAADLSPDARALVSADLAANSTAAPALGGEAYFRTSESTGVADVFNGSIWISAESSWFASPTDAKPLVDAALTATD